MKHLIAGLLLALLIAAGGCDRPPATPSVPLSRGSVISDDEIDFGRFVETKKPESTTPASALAMPPTPPAADERQMRVNIAWLRLNVEKRRIDIQQTEALLDYIDHLESGHATTWKPTDYEWAGSVKAWREEFTKARAQWQNTLQQQREGLQRAESDLADAEAEVEKWYPRESR